MQTWQHENGSSVVKLPPPQPWQPPWCPILFHYPIPTLREGLSTSTDRPCPQPQTATQPRHLTAHTKSQKGPGCPIFWASLLGVRAGHPQKVPLLGLRLCCRCLETFTSFCTRSPALPFCTGPSKVCSWPCPSSRAASSGRPSREELPSQPLPVCFQKCYPQSLNGQDRTETSYFNLGWFPARMALMGSSVTVGLLPAQISPPNPTSPSTPHSPVSDPVVLLTSP